MIVISGALVLVALVLLVMGVLGADLPFVYASIAVSTLSLLCLVVGILQRRGEPSSQDGDDLVPVEVPASTSVRSGSVAVDERHEDASTTRTLSHDLLSRGPGDEEDPPAAAAEDEQRWKADLDDGPEDDEQDEDARPSAGVRLVRLPQSAAAAQPLHEDEDEDEGEDEDHLDEDEPGEDEEPRATVLVVPGRPRYHVEGCRYLYGKQPQDLDLGDARDHGFVACGVCKPGAALAEPTAPAAPPVEEGQQEDRQQQEDQQQVDQQVEDQQQEDGPLSLEETLFGEPVFGGAGPPEAAEESAAPVTTADTPAPSSDASQEQSQDEPAEEQEASPSEPEPPAGTAPEEQAPEEQALEEQAPEEQAPEEQAPEEQPAATEPPAQQAPVKKAPVQKTPAKKTPAKKAPAKKAPAKKAAAATPVTTAMPEPASTPPATPATPSVRRIRAVGAAPTRAPGAAPAVRRVSATGTARPAPAPAPPALAAQAAPARRTGQVVVVPDRTRFHRAECRFVQGVAGATSLSRVAAGRQGYSPCGACKP